MLERSEPTVDARRAEVKHPNNARIEISPPYSRRNDKTESSFILLRGMSLGMWLTSFAGCFLQ